MKTSEMRKFLRDVEKDGWIVERTKGDHNRLICQRTGAVVTASNSPRCYSALANIKADLKRARRLASQGDSHA